jgi:hypothetical protein
MILDDIATMDPLRMLHLGARTGTGSSEFINTSAHAAARDDKHKHSKKHKHKSKASKSHKDHAHKHKHRRKHSKHAELEEGDKSSGDTPLRISHSPDLKHTVDRDHRVWERSRHGKRHTADKVTEGGVQVHENEAHKRRCQRKRRHDRVEDALQFLIEQEVDVEALLQEHGR